MGYSLNFARDYTGDYYTCYYRGFLRRILGVFYGSCGRVGCSHGRLSKLLSFLDLAYNVARTM